MIATQQCWMLSDLDEFCGSSEAILKARERLPEPYDYPNPVICFMDISKLVPFSFAEEPVECYQPIEKHRMVKQWMSWHGVKFMAWKSEDDGKIYI